MSIAQESARRKPVQQVSANRSYHSSGYKHITAVAVMLKEQTTILRYYPLTGLNSRKLVQIGLYFYAIDPYTSL
jgi:hypothetical protein